MKNLLTAIALYLYCCLPACAHFHFILLSKRLPYNKISSCVTLNTFAFPLEAGRSDERHVRLTLSFPYCARVQISFNFVLIVYVCLCDCHHQKQEDCKPQHVSLFKCLPRMKERVEWKD